MAAYQYIYVMKNVSKVYPGGREILKGLTLSFLPGAKIGVLGPNGAGKSTVLRIMAGEDHDIGGEAWAADGVRVGYLAQEPHLDESKDVMGNVMEGVGEIKALMDRFEEVSAKFGEVTDDDEMNALITEQAELQEKIDAADAWDIERHSGNRHGRVALPDRRPTSMLSGGEKRRVALCRLLLSKPDMLLLDEPTNHLDAESVAWLNATCVTTPRHRRVVTHDRYFLDKVTGWILEVDRGRGIPYEGNYSTYLEQKAKRLEQESREESPASAPSARNWSGFAPVAQGAPVQGKARVTAFEDLVSRAGDRGPDQLSSRSRRESAWATW